MNMNEVTTGIVGILVALALFLTGIELSFAMGLSPWNTLIVTAG